MPYFKNFINGQWLDTNETASNINPSDLTDVIGEYAQASCDDVQLALQSARSAWQSWRLSSIQMRADILDHIGSEILARKDELGTLLSREEGKTKAEGIGEAARAGYIFKFFAGEAIRMHGESGASVRPAIQVDVNREPVGVIGIITPWNFPIAIPAWKIAPALAFGNCVVFKPAELVPGSAWALAEIIARSGLPVGVFNLVMGQGAQVGQALVDSDQVDAISFTGSHATGKRIAAATSSRLTKLQLEMGGKNPLIILDDADLDSALNCAVQGAFYSTGQRCTASSRFIVTAGIHGRFIAALRERVAALRVGHALDDATQIGPVVDQRQLNVDLDYLDIGKNEGATLSVGGQLVERATRGYFLTPALFENAAPAMRICREEIFGPIAAVTCVANYDEALAMANDTPFGLASGIVTTSLKYAQHFRQNAQAGMVMVNCPTAGVDYHVPFGGIKGSSYGTREQGNLAIEFYTRVKTAYIA